MLRADRRTLSRSPRLVDFCVSGSSIIVSFLRRRLSTSRWPRPCWGGGAGGVEEIPAPFLWRFGQQASSIRKIGACRKLDLPRFSGEALAHLAACFSN